MQWIECTQAYIFSNWVCECFSEHHEPVDKDDISFKKDKSSSKSSASNKDDKKEEKKKEEGKFWVIEVINIMIRS